jgi:hypothetical protein
VVGEGSLEQGGGFFSSCVPFPKSWGCHHWLLDTLLPALRDSLGPFISPRRQQTLTQCIITSIAYLVTQQMFLTLLTQGPRSHFFTCKLETRELNSMIAKTTCVYSHSKCFLSLPCARVRAVRTQRLKMGSPFLPIKPTFLG